MESTVKGWLSLFTAATFYPRKRGRKRVSRGGLWLSAGIWKKGGPGGWQIRRTHSDQSPRKENEGRYRKGFGTRQQETSKSVPFPPPEYKWNVLRTGDCIVFLSIHTNLHERYSCSIKRKKKRREKEKGKTVVFPEWTRIVHCKNWISEGGLVKILSVWLLLFYFNLIWRKKL